jgi:hypothetical protein
MAFIIVTFRAHRIFKHCQVPSMQSRHNPSSLRVELRHCNLVIMYKSHITPIRLPQRHVKRSYQRCYHEIELSTCQFNAQAFTTSFVERHLEPSAVAASITKPPLWIEDKGIWEETFSGVCTQCFQVSQLGLYMILWKFQRRQRIVTGCKSVTHELF